MNVLERILQSWLPAGVSLSAPEVKESPPGMVVGVVPGGTGYPVRRDSAALLRIYGESPWLRAVVGKVGRTVASTRWTLSYVRGAENGRARLLRSFQTGDHAARKRVRTELKQQRALVEVEDHPLLDLLAGGNDALAGVQVVATVQHHLDLVGEAFLLKVRGPLGAPTDLWPIPPHWIAETPVATEGPGSAVSDYRVSWRGWKARLPAEDVVWLKDPDPFDPYGRGTGTARSLADEIEADEAAAKHIGAFFRNNARPDIVVTLEGVADDQARAFETAWLTKFGAGPTSRRRPLVVGGTTVKIDEVGQTFQEIQLTALREFERQAVISTYGVPPEILGVLTNSNRATIEGAEVFYTRHVIDPRQEFLRSILQERLVPDFDERLVLDYESMVQEDLEHKRQVFAQAPWAFDVNAHRALAGEEPFDGPEGRLHPMPYTMAFGRLDEAPPDVGLDDGDEDDQDDGQVSDDGGEGAPGDEAVSDGEEGEPDGPDDVDGGAAAEGRAAVARLRPGPGARRAACGDAGPGRKDLTDEDLELLIRTLEDAGVRRAVWGPVGVTMRELVMEFGEEHLADLGLDIEFQATRRVAEFQREFATNRSKLIDETTQAKLREVLAVAVEEGHSTDRIVDEIQAVYSDASRSRARLISRTEGTRAAGFATEESHRQAGIERQEWLATRDDGVRDSHGGAGPYPSSLDGQVVDVGSRFVIPEGEDAGATALYPGDFGIARQDINCRCGVVPIFEEDDDGNARSSYPTEEKRAAEWKRLEGSRMRGERVVARATRAAFGRQERVVVDRLREISG